MTNPDIHATAEGQIDAVTRTVSRTDNDTTFDTIVTLGQSYDTAIEDLWATCTSAERLAQWFAPVSGDLQLGGAYQIEGNAGGIVETCDAPHSFTLTWGFGGEISHLAVRLETAGADRSHLTIEHSAEVAAERWTEYGPGALGIGWDLGLLGLAHRLTTGAAASAESAAWAETEQAQRFIADSSRRWADASVIAGTPEPAARASEMRTTSFYLGTEIPGAP